MRAVAERGDYDDDDGDYAQSALKAGQTRHNQSDSAVTKRTQKEEKDDKDWIAAAVSSIVADLSHKQ